MNRLFQCVVFQVVGLFIVLVMSASLLMVGRQALLWLASLNEQPTHTVIEPLPLPPADTVKYKRLSNLDFPNADKAVVQSLLSLATVLIEMRRDQQELLDQQNQVLKQLETAINTNCDEVVKEPHLNNHKND